MSRRCCVVIATAQDWYLLTLQFAGEKLALESLPSASMGTREAEAMTEAAAKRVAKAAKVLQEIDNDVIRDKRSLPPSRPFHRAPTHEWSVFSSQA